MRTRRNIWKPLALAVVSLGVASLLRAESYDPSLFSSLKWRNIGPNRGGRSIACAGSPSRPLDYYFGAVGGGLWKTTDGGSTWSPVTDGQIKSSSVGAIGVSESNPDVVYIGMGEVELRGNIMQGDGVYKSTDAGKTWTHVGLSETQVIARVRVHPSNSDLVYVAAFGHPYGRNAERGVFRSKDGGKTWEKVLFRSDKAGAVDLFIDRKSPQVIYASIWEASRTPWHLESGGPESGLFKSTDGGDTWTEITRNPGLPKGIVGKIGVSVSGASSNRVYAIVEAEDGGVFRSDDAGATWTKINEERNLRQRAFYYSRIYADPKDPETVYVLNTGLYRSTDGGKTFKSIRAPHGDHHDLWIDPSSSQRIMNSNDGGGNVTVNGGETWTAQRYPTAQLYHVITTKDFPYHVCGAQQDNTTLCVPSDGGRNFRNPSAPDGDWLYAVGGGESGYIAPHPANPNIFYAGSQGGLLTRYDRSTGQTRDVNIWPDFFSGQPASSVKERSQWTYPIVFSPHDPNVLYSVTQHLWKTTNEGQSWERISPDLTRADPKTLVDSGGPITKDQNGPEIYATIYTVAPSKHDPATIWTGSDDGLVYITRDGGKNWENVTPKDLPELSRVSLIDASPHEPGAAYLSAKRYQLDDRAPYLYRTHDFGKTWKKIVNGIPSNDYVHAVREDVKRAGLLFAGTEHGIYVSFDDGESWQSLALNLPDTQVSDLVVEQNDLVIATHGRSFYILDNIWPLRQLTPQVASSSFHLFEPSRAIRRVSSASIDFYLKSQADQVLVEIQDKAGKTLQTFVGRKDDKPPEREESFFGPPPPSPPSTKPGHNRFTWDLRYPAATRFEGLILWGAREENGPLAPPGDYRVRLTVNDETQTQGVRIDVDPREKRATPADLEEQFRFAMEIRDRTSQANEAVLLIRDVKQQVKDRVDKAKQKRISTAADALVQKISAIEEELYQVRNRSGQDPLNFPIKLNNDLSALRRIVETGDGRPTEQSYAVFKEHAARLDGLLGQLRAAWQTELVELNRLLASRKLDPVKTEVKKTAT